MRLSQSIQRHARGGLVRGVLALALGASPLCAQGGTEIREQARRATATRADLEATAESLERLAGTPGLPPSESKSRAADAAQLRERLRTGDFQPGDRIALRLVEPNFSDTLSVRQGQTLLVPGVGEVSLVGTLRVELDAQVRRELGRYLRTVQSAATAVTRLGVFGPVGRQGFYQFPSDLMLSQAIMQAGGPLPDADMGNISIFRGDKPTWERASVLVAIQEGVTLEQLGIRGGDEIRIREKSGMSVQSVLSVLSIGLQLVSVALLIGRR